MTLRKRTPGRLRNAATAAVLALVCLVSPIQATPAAAADRDAQGFSTKQPDTWGPIQIVVYKSRRKLLVYRSGQFFRQYDVVLGFQPEGRKRFMHDAKTPEGFYKITGKRAHPRWQYFLAFNYPNEWDRERYAAEMEAGMIPDIGGKPFGIGGNVGIHGTDKKHLNDAGTDWTKGCISLSPEDIRELHGLVKVGTPVWVLE